MKYKTYVSSEKFKFGLAKKKLMFSNTSFSYCDFSGVTREGADFDNCEFMNCTFSVSGDLDKDEPELRFFQCEFLERAAKWNEFVGCQHIIIRMMKELEPDYNNHLLINQCNLKDLFIDGHQKLVLRLIESNVRHTCILRRMKQVSFQESTLNEVYLDQTRGDLYCTEASMFSLHYRNSWIETRNFTNSTAQMFILEESTDVRDTLKNYIDFLPDGEFTMWKKAVNIDEDQEVIIKLRVPETAERSVASRAHQKIRVSEAVVEAFFDVDMNPLDITSAISQRRSSRVMYFLGETVKPDSFDPDWWAPCSHGIHGFLKKRLAQSY